MWRSSIEQVCAEIWTIDEQSLSDPNVNLYLEQRGVVQRVESVDSSDTLMRAHAHKANLSICIAVIKIYIVEGLLKLELIQPHNDKCLNTVRTVREKEVD